MKKSFSSWNPERRPEIFQFLSTHTSALPDEGCGSSQRKILLFFGYCTPNCIQYSWGTWLIFAAQENSQRIAVGACATARCWEASKKFDFRQKSEIWIRQSDFVLWWQFSYDFLIWPLNIPYNHTQLLEWMQKKPIWPSFSLKQCNQNITSAQQKWDFLLWQKSVAEKDPADQYRKKPVLQH